MNDNNPQPDYVKELSDKYSRLEADVYSEAIKHSDGYIHAAAQDASVNQEAVQLIVKKNDEFLLACLNTMHLFSVQGSSGVIQQQLDQFDAYIEASRIQASVIWLDQTGGASFQPHYLIGISTDYETDKSKMLLARLIDDQSNQLVIDCIECPAEQADYLYDLQDFLFSHRISDNLMNKLYVQSILSLNAATGIKLSTAQKPASLLAKLHGKSNLMSLSGAISSGAGGINDASKLVQDSFKVEKTDTPVIDASTWRQFRIEVFVARTMIMNGKNQQLAELLQAIRPPEV